MTETTHKQEVKKGKAIIRSAVNGTLEDYEIEILDINFDNVLLYLSILPRTLILL